VNTLRHPPLFGPAIARTCTRWLGDHDCGKDAVFHVIWDEEMENGFTCSDHLDELGTVWAFVAAHKVGSDCAMPGALFFPDENVCRCEGELEPAEETNDLMLVGVGP
jgi:hypothetical protein